MDESANESGESKETEATESESSETEASETEAAETEAAEPQKHRSKSRVVMVVAGVVAAALVIGAVGFVVSTREEPEVANAGTGTDILLFLGESVAGAAVGDVFESALGALFPEAPDPTEAKVDALATQIEGLSTQIGALLQATNSLSTQVDADFSSAMLSSLQTDINAVKIMAEWITDIAAECASYSKARVAGDTANMANYEPTCEAARKDFIDGYNGSKVTNESVADRLHQYIVPTQRGVISILSARGKVLMAKGYLTAEDSQELRDLYDQIAQSQALAVYINAEFWALQEKGTGTYQKNANNVVTQWRTNQAAELAALPPVIPKAVIIATPNRATANATMWMGTKTSFELQPSAALYLGSFDTSGPPLRQADASLTAVNARGDNDNQTPFSSYGLQLTGWDYPSTQVQLDQLTAAVASSPGSTVGEKLAAAGAGRTTDFNFVQSDNPSRERVWFDPKVMSPVTVDCVTPHWYGDNQFQEGFQVHRWVNLNSNALTVSDAYLGATSGYQLPGTNLGAETECFNEVRRVWLANTRSPDGTLNGSSVASVLWARTVGTGVEEDYMAQSGNYNYNLPASTYPKSSVAKTFENDQTVYPNDGVTYTCTNPPSQKFVDQNC
ncbi:hypothetical protein IMCC26207_105191 [Actinobacteria bacterium IMCC26207]|nr:hypothetical protein IMCC26207_105191 [Actinobacteria bacterium IMCC26207]